jgi:hypothetical protein
MNREIHVPLREGLGVQFPRATRPPKELGTQLMKARVGRN